MTVIFYVALNKRYRVRFKFHFYTTPYKLSSNMQNINYFFMGY